MAVQMNGWICEKAAGQVRAAIALLRLAGLPVTSGLECPWGEPLGESITSEAWYVYYHACAFTAYATGGFPEDLPDRCREAFQAGAEAMRAYVEELAARECVGWDLPNPNYHRAVLSWPP